MGRRTALVVGGAIAVALALGGLVGGVLAESPSAGSTPAAPAALAERALAGDGGRGPRRRRRRARAAGRVTPADPELLAQLGFAYQLRWRETGDAGLPPAFGGGARRALRVRPEEANAVLGLGSLALIRHEFRAALARGPAGAAAASRVRRPVRRDRGRARRARPVRRRRSRRSSGWSRSGPASRPTHGRVRARARRRPGRVRSRRCGSRSTPRADSRSRPPGRSSRSRSSSAGSVGAAPQEVMRAPRFAVPGYPAARVELARIEAAGGRIETGDRRGEARGRRAADLPGGLAARGAARPLGPARRGERQRRPSAVIDRLLEANGVRVDLESAVYRPIT